MGVLPMFPLGSVLVPGAVFPLHVFEPRYRALVQHCLDVDEPEFGVVLIARGFEVGGGDARHDVGTVARIVEVAELPEGRYAIGAVGTRRIRVTRWLPDDPYPCAEVEDWPDEPALAPGLADRYSAVVSLLRRVLALAAELGRTAAPATIELADEPLLGSYHASAVGPFGPLDQHRLLCAPGPDERLALLDDLLTDAAEVLTLQLEH